MDENVEQPVAVTLGEYPVGALCVARADDDYVFQFQTPVHEAASGHVEEGIGEAPCVLAHGIQRGCTIVWFAKSSSGGIDARIGAVTPRDGIRICISNGIWEMKLVAGNLTIWRQWGVDTLDISVMVVKL